MRHIPINFRLSWEGPTNELIPFKGDPLLKNFIDAHKVGSYGWIFDVLIQSSPGYVKQR